MISTSRSVVLLNTPELLLSIQCLCRFEAVMWWGRVGVAMVVM